MLSFLKRKDSSFSSAVESPFAELFASGEAEAVFQESRIRVGAFTGTDKCEDCDQPLRWIVIEFRDSGEWKHLLTLDERNYPSLMSVFHQLDEYLRQSR